jgi:opacity protein-like surface antigen
MTRLSRTWVVAVFIPLFAGAPQPANAQTPAVEVSGGWRLLHVEGETFSAGWYGDALGNITNVLGVVGEISGHYKHREETTSIGGIQVTASGDARIHTFMGGVRFSWRTNPRIIPFAQALVGLAHASLDVEGSTTVGGRTFTIDESETLSDFGADIGGGVNIRATDRISVRVAGSYFKIVEEDSGDAFRFAAGLVFPF